MAFYNPRLCRNLSSLVVQYAMKGGMNESGPVKAHEYQSDMSESWLWRGNCALKSGCGLGVVCAGSGVVWIRQSKRSGLRVDFESPNRGSSNECFCFRRSENP